MKIKVSKATPLQLNWLVAKAEDALMPVGNVMLIGTQLFITVGDNWAAYGKVEYCPSEDWAQGGPIIEREKITVGPTNEFNLREGCDVFTATMECPLIQFGPTPLIAAMRCYVAYKLGDEIEIPEELV